MTTTAPLLNVDAKDSQHSSASRILKLSIVLLGGSGLALMAMFASGPSTAADETTSLIAMPTSLRAPNQMTPQVLATRLPGASPWKELALAGIQDANRCSRDVSMNANSIKSVLDGMNAKDKAKVRMLVNAEKSKAVQVRADKEAILNVPDSPTDVLKAGALAPLGFWDPLGLATNLPTGRLLFYREVELKHGRVCMLASLGILVAEKFHPLFGGDIDVPAYIAWQAVPISAFWVAVSAAIAIPEVGFSIPTFNTPADGGDYIDGFTFTMKTDRVPGDLGYDPLGLKPEDPEEFLAMQNKEINNGRLAMIATAGMIAQELVSGQKIFP
eukprot:gnl/MRDRNA2_/MRDRNA2_86393_c0_seq1.p1 gnl/MRDRNA2_/MRDRNA2_86393_c0~~gnl/MRDRNA2_/MRDRNA2_86393_c0_seq1.p1  ORF type:complete len:357 (+),score=75.94 gnl/MRDRNA2_/MRDRNA2_86393_c0_seq1:90-1073(+)